MIHILDRLIADCIDRDATRRERRESGAPPIGT